MSLFYTMQKGTNITVSKECHKLVVEHLRDTANKIGKWTEMVIKEKIQTEKAASIINSALEKNVYV